MIKRLRRRLIATTMLAVVLVFAAIMSMVNVGNHYSKEQESDGLLAILTESGGAFRKPEAAPTPAPTPTPSPSPSPTPSPSPEPTAAVTASDLPGPPWAGPDGIPGQGKGAGKGPEDLPHKGGIPKWAWDAYWAAQTEPSPEPSPEPILLRGVRRKREALLGGYQ